MRRDVFVAAVVANVLVRLAQSDGDEPAPAILTCRFSASLIYALRDHQQPPRAGEWENNRHRDTRDEPMAGPSVWVSESPVVLVVVVVTCSQIAIGSHRHLRPCQIEVPVAGNHPFGQS